MGLLMISEFDAINALIHVIYERYLVRLVTASDF